MRFSVLMGLLAGCAGEGGGGDDKTDDSAVLTDDTGGGGGVAWAPSGEGKAFFLDGESDNSLFHLELNRCLAPREGEAYYGFISKGGTEPIALGEITVVADEVFFEYEVGVDASLAGYDSFEAWANSSGTAGDGTMVWTGQVDTAVVSAIRNILIESDSTADGQGTLRALESSLQELRDFTDLSILRDGSVEEANADAERIANSISGLNEDLDGDGQVLIVEGNPGILGTNSYLPNILAELDEVAVLFDPSDPVRDYINYAYDCLQRVDDYGDVAYDYSATATGCAATETCDTLLTTTLENLGWALDGKDVDNDGTLVVIDEGTVECGIAYIAQMSSMDVQAP